MRHLEHYKDGNSVRTTRADPGHARDVLWYCIHCTRCKNDDSGIHMNLIEQIEKEEIARLLAAKNIEAMPEFAPGDTVVVSVNVVEGTRKRVQAFEGVVIAKRNRGLNSAFIVRKISSGEAVERTFQLFSPQIASIEVKRRGDVRRAKLYYLRSRSGKSARIKEKLVSKKAAAAKA